MLAKQHLNNNSNIPSTPRPISQRERSISAPNVNMIGQGTSSDLIEVSCMYVWNNKKILSLHFVFSQNSWATYDLENMFNPMIRSITFLNLCMGEYETDLHFIFQEVLGKHYQSRANNEPATISGNLSTEINFLILFIFHNVSWNSWNFLM